MSAPRKPGNGSRALVSKLTTFNPELLPQSVEGEAALLSCLMQLPKEVSAFMTSRGMGREVFHVQKHRIVAVAIIGILNAGKTVDFTTLCQWLKDRNELEAVGGHSFISQLAGAIPSPGPMTAQYAEIVMEKYALRETFLACAEIAQRCHDEAYKAAEIVGEFTTASVKISRIGHRANKPTIAETCMKVINDRQKRQDSPRDVVGLTTYLPELDNATAGLLRGDMRLICAPENTGKTTYILNILECVAIHHGQPALIIEMEITREKLVRCMAASLGWVSIDDERDHKLSMDDEIKWKEAINRIASAPISIETGSFDRNEASATIRAWKANHPDGRYVAIDNLQCIRHKDREGVNLADELQRDAYAFSGLATELDITIDLASQQTEDRAKGSRGPAEAASMVLLLSESDIFVKKSRSGGKGRSFPVSIDAEHQRVLPRDEDEPEKPRRRKK